MKADETWDDFKQPFVVLKYKGVWDQDKLYHGIVDWFAKRKWEYEEPALEHNPDKGFGETNMFMITGHRKEDEWVQYFMEVWVWAYNEKEMDTKVEGEGTKKVSSGRLQIHFHGHMKMDYDKKWNKSIFHYALKDFYNKYLIKRRLAEKYWDKLWYDTHNIHAFIKDLLNMQARSYEHKFSVGVRRG